MRAVHDLEVMSSNPGKVELGVHNTSVYVGIEQQQKSNLNPQYQVSGRQMT